MKKEMVEWEKEENEKRVKENSEMEIAEYKQVEEGELEVFKDKEKSTGDKVMDVVRAAELLASQGLPETPKSPGGPLSADMLKTTTIVMSGHTLAPQHSVSSLRHCLHCLPHSSSPPYMCVVVPAIQLSIYFMFPF